MIEPHQLVLLDTNVLIHLIRKNEVGERIEASLDLGSRPERPLISIVTVGEGLALARKFGWGEQKVAQLEELMRELVVVDINSRRILLSYAELDHETEAAGHRMGQNDLWIAATEKSRGASRNYR